MKNSSAHTSATSVTLENKQFVGREKIFTSMSTTLEILPEPTEEIQFPITCMPVLDTLGEIRRGKKYEAATITSIGEKVQILFRSLVPTKSTQKPNPEHAS